MKEIIKHQNNYFELNKDDVTCRQIQVPQEQDIKEVKARYFVYLVNDTEEFKKGKAIFWDYLNEATFFYNKKVANEEYNYIDIGIEIEGFLSHIIKRKERV